MKTKKQGAFSLTPRVEATTFRNSHNSPLAHKKKQRHLTDDGYHGIGPWGIDEMPQNPRYNKYKQKQSLIRQMNYKFNQSLKVQNRSKSKKMEFQEENKLKQLQILKQKSKTQSFKNESLYQGQTPIRFKTIVITHHTQPQIICKQALQDNGKQKMSLSKLYGNQKQGKKYRNQNISNEVKLQKTKIHSQNKQMSKINEVNSKFNKSMNKMRMKTNRYENENNNQLIFYFETKNNTNLMKREQSIMKLRNLTGRKNPRLITDGLIF